jgi:hypothetical protein
VTEEEPEFKSAELMLDLRYPQGWQEILGAPDAIDYQIWLDDLVGLTQSAFGQTDSHPEWAADSEGVKRQWQRAVELIAEAAIEPGDIDELTEAQLVETALITLKENIGAMGWDEEGLAFTIPNIFTGEEVLIDLRSIPGVSDNSGNS